MENMYEKEERPGVKIRIIVKESVDKCSFSHSLLYPFSRFNYSTQLKLFQLSRRLKNALFFTTNGMKYQRSTT